MADLDSYERWKRETYPDYWSRKSREYGLDGYCQGLIALVESQRPATAFELAIGNGFPFAENLLKRGIAISGCDISESLIEELDRCYPEANGHVGGYEDLAALDAVVKERHDVVYCFRSSWYFPDIARAIAFMLHFAKPEGVIMFDIMNADSPSNQWMVRDKYLFFPVTLLKNAVKAVLNLFCGTHYMRDKVFGISEIMYSRSTIESILNQNGLDYQVLTIAEILGRSATPFSGFEDQKLIFVARRRCPSPQQGATFH
ncbi:MAG: class I SAM-dependent methyltransferase [Ignavibacteria bacterium]